MAKLKECPFCGCEAGEIIGPIEVQSPDKEKVIERWNTRNNM